MDHEQIDSWYEQKKEELTGNYLKKIEKLEKKHISQLSPDEKRLADLDRSLGKQKKTLKEAYLKEMAALHKEYGNKSDAQIGSDLKKHFLKQFLQQMFWKHLSFLTSMKERLEKPKKE